MLAIYNFIQFKTNFTLPRSLDNGTLYPAGIAEGLSRYRGILRILICGETDGAPEAIWLRETRPGGVWRDIKAMPTLSWHRQQDAWWASHRMWVIVADAPLNIAPICSTARNSAPEGSLRQ